MKAREYNSVLTKIRTETKKFGNDAIVATRTSESLVELSRVHWKRKFECSIEGFIQLEEVGYFNFDERSDFDLFLNRKIDQLELKINESVLLKKFTNRGMEYHLTRVLLIAGISALLTSMVLYFTDTESSGFVYYSRKGNLPMSGDNAINWFHAFLIGSGLIFAYVVAKLWTTFKP